MKTCSFSAVQKSESEIGNSGIQSRKYVQEENIIIAILAILCNHRLDLTFRLNEKSLVLDITF